MTLTKRQKEILDFIRSFIEEEGYAPSNLEIRQKFNINSPATVHQHLENLEAKKCIYRTPNRHRSIEILSVASAAPSTLVPVLGAISAGHPIESYPDTETLSVPKEMLGGGENYLLRVRGDSMIGDHILDGDMVLVRKSETAQAGDTVVALINGAESTLKRFYPENGRVRLQPANPEMAPLLYSAEKVEIQGKVIGILRKFS